MADQAVLKYLSIDTTFDPCYLSLDSTFKGGQTDTLGQRYFNLFRKGWWHLPLPFICRPKSVEKV